MLCSISARVTELKREGKKEKEMLLQCKLSVGPYAEAAVWQGANVHPHQNALLCVVYRAYIRLSAFSISLDKLACTQSTKTMQTYELRMPVDS